MKWLLALVASLLLAACSQPAAPESPPSAAVDVIPAQQGSLPRIVRAYGSAEPAIDHALDISVPFEGRVMHWAVVPGAAVKRGQLLLRFTLSPAAQASWQQAQSARDLARVQHDNAAHLLEQQLATREQLAQADKALRDAQATLDALPHPQAATLDITAPFDGKVTSVDAITGANVAAGTRLLGLVQQGGLVVHAGVERNQVAQLATGQTVALASLDHAAVQAGQVTQVSETLNTATHLVDVIIVPDGALMAGESFRADIRTGDWRGWLLPRDAVMGDGNARHIFQVAQGKAVEVPVTVLGENDASSVVTGALKPELPIATTGATQLEDGMLVRATPKAGRP